MMSGKERREEILQRITNSKTPVSGAALAKSCEVSRQVIVQDIALIRAAGYDVIATNRGYICSSPVRETRVFEVNHTDEQMQDELNTIVDFGGVCAGCDCAVTRFTENCGRNLISVHEIRWHCLWKKSGRENHGR